MLAVLLLLRAVAAAAAGDGDGGSESESAPAAVHVVRHQGITTLFQVHVSRRPRHSHPQSED